MATFEELKARFMAGQGEGGSIPSLSPGPSIPIRTDSQVIPHIHGSQYFPALKALLATLTGPGDFFYTNGWWMQKDFSLDGTTGPSLSDTLIAKSRAGVDVRVLGWVLAPEVMSSRIMRAGLSSGGSSLDGVRQMLRINDDTMEFILKCRTEPTLAPKAALNILAHPAGSVHMKFVIAGTATSTVCFTGGLDFKTSRHDPNWHDVQPEVKGPVVQDCFDAYRQMWNEVQSRPVVNLTALRVTADHRLASMPTIAARTVPAPVAAKMHVQSVRTIPAMNFGLGTSAILPTNRPISYATSGLFEVKPVWERGVRAAEKVIYIEDQGFWSTEVFDWCNAVVRATEGVKVILVSAPDPEDAPNAMMEKFLWRAATQHLIRGLTAAQVNDRIALFRHKTAAIHAKTSIVDDVWAIAGSANSMRRSLYTDFEHSVAWMDEDMAAIPRYRAELWGTHLRASIPDLNAAIAAWFAIPFRGTPAAATNHLPVERLPLTPPARTPVTLTADEQVLYDNVFDTDSRQTWGPGLLSWLISKFPSLVSP